MSNFRRWPLVVVAIFLPSCSRYWVDNKMQPDHSYMIEVVGNGLTSLNGARNQAFKRAGQLCLSGHEFQSEVPNDGFWPSFQLVVKCKP
jgi:hypothetical protein